MVPQTPLRRPADITVMERRAERGGSGAMRSERVEPGSMETLSDGQEKPLTYEVMLSELRVISAGSNREPTLICEPQTQFSQDGKTLLFHLIQTDWF